jgi:hypothetical protein
MRGGVAAPTLFLALVGWASVARADELSTGAAGSGADARDRLSVGAIAAAGLGTPLVASAGVVASYAIEPFLAFGGELGAFTMAAPGEYYKVSCPACADGGIVTRAFGELRSPWSTPINVFIRLSTGLFLSKRNDGGSKASPTVRVAVGPEVRVWHIYLEPFVFAENKLDVQRTPLGVGLEVGVSFLPR